MAFKIRTATFDRAATRPQHAPGPRPSVAFAGRSNVGKSSLLNRLVNQRGLARTSSTPGRTQEIHYYDINGEAWFIDLPGYGYAKVPEPIRRRWAPMMTRFFDTVEQLRLVIVILDVRRDPTPEDRELLAMLEAHDIPYIFAVTKSDKLSRMQSTRRMAEIGKALSAPDDALIPVSSLSGAGIDDLRDVIGAVLDAPAEPEEPEATPPEL